LLKTIKIVSRASHLARVQAYKVGAKIQDIYPTIDIEYCSKKSEGDINPNQSISSGEVTGLFTHNISNSISDGEFDIGVHSWKDVPLEPSKNSTIFGTIERGDMRDMLFIKKKSLTNLKKETVSIFTSSPRRKYISEIILRDLLPFKKAKLSFYDIRGNIETRLKKLNESNLDGLIIAKTAIDRLLSDQPNKRDQNSTIKIKSYIDEFKWMVLPLSCFPTAPGQGAIGIEVNNTNEEVINVVNQINNKRVFQMVQHEKSKLNIYGGGCHQKIGVSNWMIKDIELESIKGKTEKGESLDSFKIIRPKNERGFYTKRSNAFPSNDNEKKTFLKKAY
jgi:hydroxymethylbilane synthase